MLLCQLRAGVAAAAVAIAGIVAGSLAARALSAVLYGITPFDPLAWMAAAGVLAGSAVFASDVPARRAARVDPLIALRTE